MSSIWYSKIDYHKTQVSINHLALVTAKMVQQILN